MKNRSWSRMPGRLLAAALITPFVPLSVLAKTPYAPEPPPVLALPAAPAAPPPVEDKARTARMQLGRQLLELDGTSESVRQNMSKVLPLLRQAMLSDSNIASLSTTDQAKLFEFLGDAFNEAVPELLDKYAGYFADNLSDGELTDLIAVFRKPNLQKYAALKVRSTHDLEAEFADTGREAALKAIKRFVEWKKQPG